MGLEGRSVQKREEASRGATEVEAVCGIHRGHLLDEGATPGEGRGTGGRGGMGDGGVRLWDLDWPTRGLGFRNSEFDV